MKKIKIGLDLTKETKNLDNFIVQGDPNPDMDKMRIDHGVKVSYIKNWDLNLSRKLNRIIIM